MTSGWITAFWLRIKALLYRHQLDRDLEEELRFHVAARQAKYEAVGMTPEDADAAAHRQFGNVTGFKEACREMWTFAAFETLWQDIRYGLRQLRRDPGFTAVAVLTLALGIGANTAIFSLIDAVLLKMLPVQNPQQLVLLDWTSHGWPKGMLHTLAATMDRDKSGRLTCAGFSYPAYQQIRDRDREFSSVLAIAANVSHLTVGYNGEPGRADGQLVSGTFFTTLGVQPFLGRALTPDDDRVGANPAAMISYGYWERRFGGSPGIVGRSITVNSVPFTIVGVTPPEFYGLQAGRAVDVWLPLHSQPQVQPDWSPGARKQGQQPAIHPGSLFEARDNWWVLITGRLRPGVSEEQARAELEVIFQQSIAPDVKPSTKPELIPHLGLQCGSKGLNDLREEFSKPLFILMVIVGLVLLIACANVANLLLARGTARQKEIAVRLAVGAGRARLVRQLLTESVLVAGLGGAVGLVLAYWGTDVLVAFMASGRQPITLSVTPDPRVLGFSAAVSLLTGILFGLSPALRSTRLDLTPALKDATGDLPAAISGKRGSKLGLGRTLVVAQVALSLLLLVGAGLFVRTLANLQSVNAGFNERNLLLFGIDPTQDGYKGQRLADFYRELTRRLEMLPGVRSVSMSYNTLIGGGVTIDAVRIQGSRPEPAGKDARSAYVMEVGPRFFETIGIPLLLGRTITRSDREGSPSVVAVNERFVREFLGSGNPIGRRFALGGGIRGKDIEIVGVVADAKYNGLRAAVPPTVYVPSLQELEFPLGQMHFEVRTAGNPTALTSAVRRVAQAMDARLALYDVKSEVEQIDESLFQERLLARLTSFFGALAALLASVGIYGIMAFAVTRRTREIGIRMALGATRGEITEMVLRETLTLLGIGIAIGMIVALAASRLISSLLYGLKSSDPLTLGLAALIMAFVAAVATYIPARRAAKVDPMVALRYE